MLNCLPTYTVTYDPIRRKWICVLPDGEVVIADTKERLEEFLDWNDERLRDMT